MRTLIALSVLFALAAGLADTIMPRMKSRAMADVLEEEINRSPLLSYTDPYIGFTAQYPECFKMDKTEDDTIGSVTFRHDTTTHIIMECFTCRISDTANPDRAIAKLAGDINAQIAKTGDGYILHGRIYENGVPIEGYRHYTKYTAKDKLWIAYSLVYPEQYGERLGRLFDIIRQWEPWQDRRSAAA